MVRYITVDRPLLSLGMTLGEGVLCGQHVVDLKLNSQAVCGYVPRCGAWLTSGCQKAALVFC